MRSYEENKMKNQEKKKLALRVFCLVLAALMVFGVAYVGIEAVLHGLH